MVRVKRICSKISDYDTNSETILNYYKCRGYPDSIIATTRQNAASLDRDTLLAQWSLINDLGSRTATDDLHVVITYNPANADSKATLDKFWPITNSSKNPEAIHNKTLLIGHRRNCNLSDILCHTRIRFPPTLRLNQVSGKIMNTCVYTSNIVCNFCPKVDTSGEILSTNSTRTYSTPQGGSCGYNNLVYLVTCKIFNKQYVGETSRTLKQRFYEHFYD